MGGSITCPYAAVITSTGEVQPGNAIYAEGSGGSGKGRVRP